LQANVAASSFAEGDLCSYWMSGTIPTCDIFGRHTSAKVGYLPCLAWKERSI